MESRNDKSKMLKTSYVKVKMSPVHKVFWQEAAKKEGLPLAVIIRRVMNDYFNLAE